VAVRGGTDGAACPDVRVALGSQRVDAVRDDLEVVSAFSPRSAEEAKGLAAMRRVLSGLAQLTHCGSGHVSWKRTSNLQTS
jgi:hypothetical protein